MIHLLSLDVVGNVRTAADQISIAVGVGNPSDSGPIFSALLHPLKRVCCLFSAELVLPGGLEEILGSVGGVLHDFGHCVDLLVDLDQGLSEPV